MKSFLLFFYGVTILRSFKNGVNTHHFKVAPHVSLWWHYSYCSFVIPVVSVLKSLLMFLYGEIILKFLCGDAIEVTPVVILWYFYMKLLWSHSCCSLMVTLFWNHSSCSFAVTLFWSNSLYSIMVSFWSNSYYSFLVSLLSFQFFLWCDIILKSILLFLYVDIILKSFI